MFIVQPSIAVIQHGIVLSFILIFIFIFHQCAKRITKILEDNSNCSPPILMFLMLNNDTCTILYIIIATGYYHLWDTTWEKSSVPFSISTELAYIHP